ncbi:MAG: hypothetical protein ACR2KQ_08480 [Actinomycetota bacterium]
MIRIVLCLSLSLGLASCSSEPGPAQVFDQDESAEYEVQQTQPTQASTSSEKRGIEPDDKQDGSSHASSEAPNASQDREDETEGSSARRVETLSAPPPPGGYTFAQEGWEELCQAGTCDRYDLAPRQRIEVVHRSADGSLFRTTTRSSGSREQSIDYELTPNRLVIDRIRSEFEYGAFRTTSEIVPRPSILAARLPLRVGDSWSGQWSDRNGEVDGSYSFEVIEKASMTAAGRPRDVFVMKMSMTFRGEFSGSTDMKVWLDPDEAMIAASRGRTEITSSLGTYRTRFTTSLTGEP